MSKRRTHSSIDSLPADVRETLTAMVVDGDWPSDWPAAHDGKPTYDDLVDYAAHCGSSVSRSAVGRWAKGLLAFELLRSRAEIVRSVMDDDGDPETAAKNQTAAAQMITARVLEATCDGGLTGKQARELASAIRDCQTILIRDDSFRQTVRTRAKAADAAVTEIVKKKQIDPETLKLIREQIYGIVN